MAFYCFIFILNYCIYLIDTLINKLLLLYDYYQYNDYQNSNNHDFLFLNYLNLHQILFYNSFPNHFAILLDSFILLHVKKETSRIVMVFSPFSTLFISFSYLNQFSSLQFCTAEPHPYSYVLPMLSRTSNLLCSIRAGFQSVSYSPSSHIINSLNF